MNVRDIKNRVLHHHHTIMVCLFVSLLSFSLKSYSQTCNSAIPLSKPTTQYENYANGTVKDTKTGLTWMKCSLGLSGLDCSTGSINSYNWKEALEVAKNYSFASKSDWRLPNIKELSSLHEIACHDPAVNENVFPAQPFSVNVSSSPSVLNSDRVMYLYFRYGRIGSIEKNSSFVVRLVRGGL